MFWAGVAATDHCLEFSTSSCQAWWNVQESFSSRTFCVITAAPVEPWQGLLGGLQPATATNRVSCAAYASRSHNTSDYISSSIEHVDSRQVVLVPLAPPWESPAGGTG